ncbi:hypothetical protein FQA39_LY17847 [Lamprigera yunnana]|nr:hypothetical protein FQA39_LY17847 [Lamprigera yunnana]
MSNLKTSIFTEIKAFEDYLLSYKSNDEDMLLFLQNSSVQVVAIITKFKEYCDNSSLTKHQYFAITTYLMQYYSIYEFLKEAYCTHRNRKQVIAEVIQCGIKQFFQLCNKSDLLFKDNHDNTVGSFIMLMDSVLNKLEEVNIENDGANAESKLEESAIIVEGILEFSMSVAQVGYNNDIKIITAACQRVLSNLKNIRTEVNSETCNLSLCNLLIEIYMNSLCALEAKVNVIVLNLCLKVFPQFHTLILHLYNACLDTNCKSELELIISDFDLFMDRIFQIGLFCLACSSTNKRSAEIKVILTNLQFLEQELVPAFMATRMTSLKYRRMYADVLKKFWCSQVKKLQTAVHYTIEPEAYSKLIYEELQQKTESIWEHITKDTTLVESVMFEPFFVYTTELGKMIKTSMNSFPNNMRKRIVENLHVVYNVLQELEITKRKFLDEALTTLTAQNVNKKLFKRSKVLVRCIKNLWTSVREDGLETCPDNSSELTLETQMGITEEELLKSIIARSRQLIKDRTMYNTLSIAPQLNCTFTLNTFGAFYKSLIIKDLTTKDSYGSNCKDDKLDMFFSLQNLQEQDLHDSQEEVTMQEEVVHHVVEAPTIGYIENQSLHYVLGFIVKSIKPLIKDCALRNPKMFTDSFAESYKYTSLEEYVAGRKILTYISNNA